MKIQILKCEDEAALYVDGAKKLQFDFHWEVADVINLLVDAELEVVDFDDYIFENELSYKDEWERVWINGEGFLDTWPFE